MTVTADDFLSAFFGPGNDALPGADIHHPNGAYIAPFLEPLRSGIRRSLILPRRHANGRTDAYVVNWDTSQTATMRGMLEAFVAHSIVPFDGRVARLNESDPVDAAVIGLVGHGCTFVLQPPTQDAQSTLWKTLSLLRDLLDSKPDRNQSIPRPLGRIMAEFNAALGSGAVAASAELLDEMTTLGGLSPINLAYLRVHRLGRLGRSAELLRLPSLDDVIASRPPGAVSEAILSAWLHVEMADVNTANDAVLLKALSDSPPDVSRVAALTPAVGSGEDVNPDALLAAAVISLVTRDVDMARRLSGVSLLPSLLLATLRRLCGDTRDPHVANTSSPNEVAEESAHVEDISPPPGEPEVSLQGPTSWAAWGRLLTDDQSPWSVSEEVWSAWSGPAVEDEELALALERVGGTQAERAWGMVGPFLDADELGTPAWRSAGALLLHAAAYDRWSPADLSGVQALLEVFTRGGPPASQYSEILDLLGGAAPRWASVNNALPTLDMVDVLARAACSDGEARLRFASSTLEPLNRHRWRMAPEQLWLAEKVSIEIGLPLDWTVSQAADDVGADGFGHATLLMYSLDAGALRRAADGLAELAPHARVHLSSSKVGSDQLRAHSRAADVIALATRCAKHAATGFIRQNARETTVIKEADGAGSASLLRAAIEALRAFTS
jgi:hypothetical protein